ncbi:MAG: YbjN domain-containing protein [Bacteroidales bacterium]
MKAFEKVRNYLLDLDYNIILEDKEETLFIVEKEEDGISNLIVDCEEPILIIEQHLFNLEKADPEIMMALLQKNMDIIHGAFAIDETGERVVFRDTLQLENLDRNEIEGTLNSLSLLLSEYSEKIIQFASVEIK